MNADIAPQVKRVICRTLQRDIAPDQLHDGVTLLELGFDSLTLVHLSVALEDDLGIAEFPLQDWTDAESAREGGFTVGALIAMCLKLLGPR